MTMIFARRPASIFSLFVTMLSAASSCSPASAQTGKIQFPNTHGKLQPLGTAAGSSKARLSGRAAVATPALTVLHTFAPRASNGSFNTDGFAAQSALLAPGDGYLYGTSFDGGSNGYGTIFRIGTDGNQFQLLHTFSLGDGAQPGSALIAPGDGYLYGTAEQGGPSNSGLVFRMRPDGTGYQVMYALNPAGGSSAVDGVRPDGSLLAPGDGYLYGTAEFGGVNSQGTVFRLYPDGTGFQVIYDFSPRNSNGSFTDGAGPQAALIAPGDGYLYGTTNRGSSAGGGTVFRLHPDGTGYATVYTFNQNNGDGSAPSASLLALGDGYLYGTTQQGGANGSGDGTVFRLHPDGSGFTTLYSFGGSDGAAPRGALAAGGDGTLYGTTYVGGANSQGTVFRIRPDGSAFPEGTHLETLYSFSTPNSSNAQPDGSHPPAALTIPGDGFLYGVTQAGGANATGTVFRLTKPVPTVHLLWSNTDHRAMFWNVDADGTFTVAGGYGPYTDGSDPTALWTATALATGPDGVSHILWNNVDHRVMLWNVQTDGSFQVIGGYGPYSDDAPSHLWSAAGLSVGPDNVIHIIWGNTDHRAMFWNVQQNGSFQVVGGYGPYSDDTPTHLWDAIGVSTGLDNVSHLLWSNTDFRSMFWNVSNTDGSFNVIGGYGPYTDDTPSHLWSAIGVSTGPDNVSHLLWSNTDFRSMFWNVSNTDGSFNVIGGYGPYTDDTPNHLWSSVGIATGLDNVSHLLWSNTDHRAMLWNTSNTDGSFNVIGGYGPYTDDTPDHLWNAVSVSVGP